MIIKIINEIFDILFWYEVSESRCVSYAVSSLPAGLAYLKRPVAHLAVATALDSTAPGPQLVL